MTRRVRGRRKAAKKERRAKCVRPGLLKYAGKAEELPADAARNFDHYLYGHPKR
jgi:hypothetical protein